MLKGIRACSYCNAKQIGLKCYCTRFACALCRARTVRDKKRGTDTKDVQLLPLFKNNNCVSTHFKDILKNVISRIFQTFSWVYFDVEFE